MGAAAGTAVTTFASEATNWTSTAALNAVIDTAQAVRSARKQRADVIAMTTARLSRYRKLVDSGGRRLIVPREYAPGNVNGIASYQDDGEIEGLNVAATDGFTFAGSYPESVFVLNSQDSILWEGAERRFRFEEIQGPEKIVLGIWAYTGVLVRRQGASVKRYTITGA